MDKKTPDISLLQAYLIGEISSEEEKMVDEWLRQSPENINMLEALAGVESNSVSEFDYIGIKNQILEKIDFEEAEKVQEYGAKPVYRPRIIIYRGRKAAVLLKVAAAIMVMAMAGLFALTVHEPDGILEIAFKEVTSAARTVTSYTLPDGSTVELNANSTLKYPASFSEKERIVYLEGEAFFEIVSEKQRPFKVFSGELSTTVLGTKFNVNYIPTLGKVEVALIEGSVEVDMINSGSMGETVVLQPDEWVNYYEGSEELMVQQGVYSKTLWRKGILEFEEVSLEEVALILENWYGVAIRIQDSEIRDRKIVGSFEDENLEHVLETLEFIAGIEFRIDKKESEDVMEVILTERLE